ncbi:MAG: TonB-dependent receptor [Pseudomonadales bacterium]|nr:TonB-dependent receptor [Pseudomonadales bacterium]
MLFRQFTLIMGSVLATVAFAEGNGIEEQVITGTRDLRKIEVSDTVEMIADAATLLRKAPGATFNGNGPISGIPQYRGMYGSRVNVEVNGMNLSSGGPNWMDPPLSYAPAAQLESLEVYRGIAPVSGGQETIGGLINATTWSGDFADSDDFESSGRVRIGGQSVNQASLASATVITANKNHRVKFSALAEQANDAKFPGGKITPSEYQRQRYDVGYGFYHDGHTVQLDVARQETGDSGAAALPMDIQSIDSDQASMRYQIENETWALKSKLYFSQIEHGMTNYHLRQAPMMESMWRRNFATGDNAGFKVSTEFFDAKGSWVLGVDGHSEMHNSNIDNPNNAMFFVVNFNDAKRQIAGLFAERQHIINTQWQAELGLRYNHVAMDADEVDGSPAMMSMMGMSPGQTLRDRFNNAERQQDDNNIDWVAKLSYSLNDAQDYYLGLSRKSRSASYQERYLWLPMESAGGLADGRTYIGNIELDAEVAHEIEAGMDYQQHGWVLSPRIFYKDVKDFIQGTEANDMPAMQFTSMMNNMNGTAKPAPLQFNNVDARFYGVDMNWAYQIDSEWSVSGLINYVRGERKDISDNLYRISPANASMAVNYQQPAWAMTVECIVYDKQDKVSATNNEQTTSGYSLLNIKGYWQVSQYARLGFGIDNITDKSYSDHLGGYNRAMNTDVAVGERLPGYGRNVFTRIDIDW